MKSAFARRWSLAGSIGVLSLWLPLAASAEPTNGPLVALGLTNVPIGEAALELIEGGILFVHNTDAGAGVSVQLGEADSGVFLYPLTGYIYGGDTMEARAYGRFNGSNDQFISSVSGVHNGDQSGTVTVDFSSLGATSVSVFVGDVLLGQVSATNLAVRVAGDGNGCRANPWWQANGRFGALVELADGGNYISLLGAEGESSTAGGSIFISPDDATNTVEFVSRVDVTAFGLGSFCLTDARVGAFHQRHKALGTATLYPTGGRLVVGNLVSNIEDGVLVTLPGVSAFDVQLLPVELATNAVVLLSAYGTSSSTPGMPLGVARLENSNGFVRLNMALSIEDGSRIEVRSNGVIVGSVTLTNGAAAADLSGSPRLAGSALFARTMETPAGMAVRLDRPTTFTLSDGAALAGDEVRLLALAPAVFESIESVVLGAYGMESLTITGETASVTPPPALNVARSAEGIVVSWPDPNQAYFLEAAISLADGFAALDQEPSFNDNHCQLSVRVTGDDYRFFRLRRRMPSTD